MQPTQNYVSVLFSNFLQPIVDLFELLDRANPRGPNEVQASPVENGYAVSIVALCAFVVESAVGRTRYMRNEAKRETAACMLARLGDANLAKDTEEVFVVRDSIAHNHLWEAVVRWDEVDLVFDSPPKFNGFRDGKFKRVVDMNDRRTRRMRLDVFPPRIHRATAVAVLRQTVKVLRFLEGLDHNYVYLSPQHVKTDNGFIPFYKWVDGL